MVEHPKFTSPVFENKTRFSKQFGFVNLSDFRCPAVAVAVLWPSSGQSTCLLSSASCCRGSCRSPVVPNNVVALLHALGRSSCALGRCLSIVCVLNSLSVSCPGSLESAVVSCENFFQAHKILRRRFKKPIPSQPELMHPLPTRGRASEVYIIGL